jgi:hypothetical protein
MMEGYENDDIYIMVEDEFHSIAQTFTQHLHHAEYQRLKKKARDVGPPALQPTEQMREETTKKMGARTLRARQKETIANLANGANLSMQENEGQEDDPWLRTSLAGLMTNASNHKRTALVGLEKIQSSTRAAKGFGRVTGDSPADRREKMSVFDIFGAHRESREDRVHGQEHEISELNLDPSRFTRRDSSDGETGLSRGATSKPASRKSAMTNLPSSTQSAAGSKPGSRFREPSLAARKLFDDLQNVDMTEDNSRGARRPSPLASLQDRNPKPTKGRKLQIGDIPTFLV